MNPVIIIAFTNVICINVIMIATISMVTVMFNQASGSKNYLQSDQVNPATARL